MSLWAWPLRRKFPTAGCHRGQPRHCRHRRRQTYQSEGALRVGLIAGPEATWDLAAARVAEQLRGEQGLEVYYAWDCVDLGLDDPTDFDCLVLLGWPAASSRQRVKRIELYCRGGGSLVALRSMHAEIPGWSSFTEEVLGGRQPAGRRCRLLEVQRSENAWHHPLLEGIETIIAEGEVYMDRVFRPTRPYCSPLTMASVCSRWPGPVDTKAAAFFAPRLDWTMTSARQVSCV